MDVEEGSPVAVVVAVVAADTAGEAVAPGPSADTQAEGPAAVPDAVTTVEVEARHATKITYRLTTMDGRETEISLTDDASIYDACVAAATWRGLQVGQLRLVVQATA
ncbi:unnamed protein product, partial [Symbiodinium pilosum]